MVMLKSKVTTVDEMSIVDMLTKLIFDSESVLDDTEQFIVDLLAQIEPDLVNPSRRDVSEYLRAMGVSEMIRVVSQIKKQMDTQQGLIVTNEDSYQPTAPR